MRRRTPEPYRHAAGTVEHAHPGVQKAVAQALRFMGEYAAPHASAIAARLADDDSDVREFAVGFLGRLAELGRLGEHAVPHSTPAPSLLGWRMATDNHEVLLAAAQAFGELGPEAEPAAPHTGALAAKLEPLDYDDGEQYVRRDAAW